MSPVVAPASHPAAAAATVAAIGCTPFADQRRRDRAAETERAVGGEVEPTHHPVGDEHAQRQEREEEAHRQGADEQVHAAVTRVIGPVQHSPRRNALSPAPAAPRSSPSRWSSPRTRCCANSRVTSERSTTVRCGTGR